MNGQIGQTEQGDPLLVRVTSVIKSRRPIRGKVARVVRMKPRSMAIIVEIDGQEWELFPGEWEGYDGNAAD